MNNYFLVICNTNEHVLRVMEHYTQKYSTSILNKVNRTLQVGTSVFVFISRKDTHYQQLGSWEFLGVIFPPGYERPDLFEITAISRTRW